VPVPPDAVVLMAVTLTWFSEIDCAPVPLTEQLRGETMTVADGVTKQLQTPLTHVPRNEHDAGHDG